MGNASVCGTECLEEVAPDGAEVAGLELRAKVRDESAGAVVGLESSSDGGERGGGRVGNTNAGERGVGERGRNGVLGKAPEEGTAYVVCKAVVGRGRGAAENAGKGR